MFIRDAYHANVGDILELKVRLKNKRVLKNVVFLNLVDST